MMQLATENLRAEGEKIAEQLGGLLYNGPWIYKGEFIGHTITDTHPVLGTGTTFICKDLEDCRERLKAHRDAFAAQRHRFTRRLTSEMIQHFREQGLIPPPGPPLPEELPKTVPMPLEEAFPLTMSMEEFRTRWEPRGWKLLIIGPTSTWREEWGAWEAIRDIVQNCLDEAESYDSGFDRLGFWIADQGKGVAVADFLLGPPRLKPDYARGKYGEGMKIAALAMIRAGYPTLVETREREIWMVFLEQPTGDHQIAMSLTALWRPQPDKDFRWGTRFQFIGYRGPDFKYRFAVNIPRQYVTIGTLSPLESPRVRYNEVIEFPFPPETGEIVPGVKPADFIAGSRIFSRDIYLRAINSVFSYNLWGFELAPDRHGPKSEEDMWIDAGRTWTACTNRRLLVVLMQMIGRPPKLETDESLHLSMDVWKLGKNREGKSYLEIMQDNQLLWQAAWDEVYGDHTVLRTNDRWDNIVKHLGYESYSVNHWMEPALRKVIKDDASLVQESQERLREVKVIEDNRLSPLQLACLEVARAITRQNEGSQEVKGVYAAMIPPASDRVRTAGMYATSLREIYINLDQLDHGRQTVDTVIHELAHHRSGAEDLEEPHAAAMTRIAGVVVEETSRGVYDDYLRNPAFVW